MMKTGLVLCCLMVFFLTFCPKAEAKLIGYWPLEATSGTTATNIYLGDPFLTLIPFAGPFKGTCIVIQ